jgi:sigma-B regulation protein RsbU (phosphoserine phosphatase)
MRLTPATTHERAGDPLECVAIAECVYDETIDGYLISLGVGGPALEVAAIELPAYVGGSDLQDLFHVVDDTLAIVIADVAGDGMPTEALRSYVRTLVRSVCAISPTPEAALTRANRTLRHARLGITATVFLGWLDVRTGRLRHANAGHPHPLRVSSNGEVRLLGEVTGPLLGTQDSVVYGFGTETLALGETIVLYTDGMIEVDGAARRFRCDQGLAAFLSQHADEPLRDLCAAISHADEPDPAGHRRRDDATLLAVRWKGPVLAARPVVLGRRPIAIA